MGPVDSLHSVVNLSNEADFLPNLSSNTPNNNTTLLLDWLHQQYQSIATHFHQHILSMERLTYDDGIRVTGTNISSTPKSSNLDLLTDNLRLTSVPFTMN